VETVLYRFNPWWEKEPEWRFIPREKYLNRLKQYLHTKDVVIITGLRRVGKTTIMKMMIKELLKQGIPPGKIFYISLDFYSLERFSILDIIEEFFKLQKISFSEKVYLFLDEVAYKKDFQIQLKNLYDLYNAKVFASSSSASILRDRKAMLTGRERVIEVLPLDFKEYLLFKNLKIPKSDKHLLEVYFEDYMQIGGIPEYVLTEDPEYLKQLIDDVLYKDIISFHGVKEKALLREFFRLLMERSGKQVSLNRISRILNISVDTARRFLGYFEEAFIIHGIERCGKLNERLKAPKKIYAGDVGIRNILTGFRDKGAVFENLVFLQIKNQKPCYIYKDGIELDFLTEDGTLIEVKYGQQLNEKQKKLFESFNAKKKVVISDIEDYLSLIT